MNIVEKSVSELVPYERNPRKNDQAVDALAASIKEFGFKVPIIIDKDNTIIAGHTRLKAAKMLGLETVPCVLADDLPPEKVKAFRLADNKVAEQSEWDEGLLALELLDLKELGQDLTPFGFLDDSQSDVDKEVKDAPPIEAMELKAFEHHDYVVFVFDNQFDWMKIVEEFKLHKVNAGYGKTRKIGLGRVIRGSELVRRLGNPPADNQQGA